MNGFVTDRLLMNVSRRNELSSKGWDAMTADERIEWTGDPFSLFGTNLISYGAHYSGTVDLKHQTQQIVATAKVSGIYLYSVLIIGEANKFENKKLTLSINTMFSEGGGTPQIALYWHDTVNGEDAYEYAGASLSAARSVSFDTTDFPNTGERRYLAMYVYVTTHTEVAAGATATFRGVMLENGSTRHEYVPYSEIGVTETTKGAYNYSDLNRIERIVSEISEMENLNLTTKTDWAMWDIPTATDMARYISNLNAIKQHFSISTAIPTSMSNLDYHGANNIEKMLLTAYEKATVWWGAW